MLVHLHIWEYPGMAFTEAEQPVKRIVPFPLSTIPFNT